ncbi:MAG: glycosyltransferase family 1 protein [Acidimicrobiales bacterium]
MNNNALRVGINLLWCVPSVVGGTEEYAVRTTKSLLDRSLDDMAISLFVLRPFADAYPELVERCDTEVAEIDGRNRARRVWTETTWLRQLAQQKKLQLLHHVGGTVPTLRPVPAVMTLHDLQPLALPQNFSFVKRHYLRTAIPRSVARSELVVAPSGFVRDEVVARFDLSDDQVVTVSAGYDLPRLLAIDSPGVPGVVKKLITDDQPYFVYPAITHHHKDHATALRAVAGARDRGHPVRLVLTGGTGLADGEVDRLIDELAIQSLVHRLGRVEREVLDLLVARAEALLFPSRFEGFGIPVLEALALGCPVIAADATAVPEVAGEAGTLVPPGDVAAWVDAIVDRTCNIPDRASLADAGRRQAAQFAWNRAGEQLESVYRRILQP